MYNFQFLVIFVTILIPINIAVTIIYLMNTNIVYTIVD